MTLLVANLLFLAWAEWIDSPRDAGAQDSLSHLPRLQLVGESPEAEPAAVNLPSMLPVTTDLTMIDTVPVSTGLPASTEPAPIGADEAVFPSPAASQSCTSVGPFNDIAHAARAAGLLTQRGFQLHQRAEEGETIEGYWVFVGGLQSDDDVNEVVDRLEKNGFTDAHVMKNFSTNRRISVGMFSTRERADKRAAAVKKMGLAPEVGERRFPGTVYWVDVALTSAEQTPPEYLFADIGRARVQMQPCPADSRPTQPTRTTIASAPGVPTQ
jgi:cell division septation protein DedD